MTFYNYLLLFWYAIIFVVVVLCRQSSVKKHLEIGRVKPKSSPSMSRYMTDLYDKYKDDEINEESMVTVRSILPMKGKLESREMLVYNLSNVPASEEILKAELHVHLRRRKSKPQIYSLQLWNLMGTSFAPVEEISTTEKGVRWTKFDTTNAVLECTQSNAEGQRLLGVSIEGDNGRGLVRPLSVKRMFASNVQPFLVLFSQKIERNNTTDGNEERLSEIITETLNSDRNKRSIQNNEVPEYPVYDVPNLHSKRSSSSEMDAKNLSQPPFLKNRRQRRRKRRKRNHKFRSILDVIRKKKGRHENLSEVDSDDLNKFTCQKRKLVINFKDFEWDSFVIAPDEVEINYCEGDCKNIQQKEFGDTVRKGDKMTGVQTKQVEVLISFRFAVIRVAQVIDKASLLYSSKYGLKEEHSIDVYESNFIKYSWTNHAYLQALYYNRGYKMVPPPCCSPQKLSSVPILYLEHLDTVLENLPNTKVEKCKCR